MGKLWESTKGQDGANIAKKITVISPIDVYGEQPQKKMSICLRLN